MYRVRWSGLDMNQKKSSKTKQKTSLDLREVYKPLVECSLNVEQWVENMNKQRRVH